MSTWNKAAQKAVDAATSEQIEAFATGEYGRWWDITKATISSYGISAPIATLIDRAHDLAEAHDSLGHPVTTELLAGAEKWQSQPCYPELERLLDQLVDQGLRDAYTDGEIISTDVVLPALTLLVLLLLDDLAAKSGPRQDHSARMRQLMSALWP